MRTEQEIKHELEKTEFGLDATDVSHAILYSLLETKISTLKWVLEEK